MSLFAMRMVSVFVAVSALAAKDRTCGDSANRQRASCGDPATVTVNGSLRAGATVPLTVTESLADSEILAVDTLSVTLGRSAIAATVAKKSAPSSSTSVAPSFSPVTLARVPGISRSPRPPSPSAVRFRLTVNRSTGITSFSSATPAMPSSLTSVDTFGSAASPVVRHRKTSPCCPCGTNASATNTSRSSASKSSAVTSSVKAVSQDSVKRKNGVLAPAGLRADPR